MNELEKKKILEKTQEWFRETIATNHIINTKKLEDSSEFNINPFLAVYLANFLCGNSEPKSIAKALIYPRVLGTSITTSFGTNIQKFTSEVLTSFGSTTSGIDIEFTDQIDGHKKYCQLKAGPNTINKDDVETIASHFRSVINLARTNSIRLSHEDLIVGIIYGEESELSGHYKRVISQYNHPVVTGKDFWTRLTGDKDFYADIIKCIGDIASESNFSKELNTVVDRLANSSEIIVLSKEISKN